MRKSRFLKFALLLILTLSLTMVCAIVSTANDEKGVDMMAAILADETLNQYKQGDTVVIANDGYIGIPVELTIYYDASRPTKSGTAVDATNLILYIVNADFERIGTDSDVEIIKSMMERGYIVTVLDYKNHSKAKSPDLDFSIQLLRDKIYKGNYFTDRSVFMAGDYPNSFVVPSGYDVSPHHVFWEIDKHGTDGTFDKIIEYWNNDFRAWNTNKELVIPWVDDDGNRKATQTAHDGTEPVWLNADGTENPDGTYIKIKHTKAEKITDCVKKDGSPIDLNLYMSFIYPTGSAEVPVLALVGSSEHTIKGSASTQRPQLIGAALNGYAGVVFDHGWTPMSRADHYGYFDGSTPASGSVTGNNTTYSIQFYNEVEILTAAMRYIRYESLAEEKFNFKLDAIGAYGNSKGGWMAYLGAEDPYTASGERRVYVGHHGETRYDNGDTETVGIIDGGEPQPWLTYNGVEIDGGADFVYCSCGGTSESIMPGHAPTFISCQLGDGSCWGSSREFIQTCRESDVPALWVEVNLGHTFASGPDTRFGIADTYQALFDFMGYWLKDEAPVVEYIHADMTYGGMPTYAPFVVKFTGPVDESELSKITLAAAGGTPVSGRWEAAFAKTEWTFYPDYLDGNTEYTMTVPAGVLAANGKGTEAAKTYSVTTGYEITEKLTHVAGKNGNYVSFTVPFAADVTEFEADTYLVRVTVSDDAVNKLGVYAVTGFNPANPDGATVGNLLGTVPVNGPGFYDIDITEYLDGLTPGAQVTLLIKNEKAVGNTTIFSYDGETSRPGTLLVSGTVENKVTTLDGNGVIEIGKTKITSSYPLDPFYNNLSYNTIINCTAMVKNGTLSYDDTGRRFTVSFRVYDTTSRIIQVDVKDASVRDKGVLDYNGIIFSFKTKANEWVDISFDIDIYDPAEFGANGLIQKNVSIKTYGFGEEVHPIYFDDFKSVETVTDVAVEEVALVTSTTKQRQNPLVTPYGTIPDQYASVEDYPFVVFDASGLFITASGIWGTDSGEGALSSGQKQSYINYIILLRRDYHYNEAVYNNFSMYYGDLRLDLGGHKLYLEQTHTSGMFHCHAKRSHRTDTVITNGEIVFNGGRLISIGSWDTANYDYKTEVKQFNFNFDGITFSYGEKATATSDLVTVSGVAVPVISNLYFDECAFDFEKNVPSGTTLMSIGSSNDNAIMGVTVKGGLIKGTDLSGLTFYKKAGSVSTFEFEKDGSGKYLVQKIKGGTPASISVGIDGNSYSYAASDTEGEYTVYTVAKSPLDTPYGSIDAAYADIAAYPFAIFKKTAGGYEFVTAIANAFLDDSVKAYYNIKADIVIYLRTNFTVTNRFSNLTQAYSGITLDLGGNVLTANSASQSIYLMSKNTRHGVTELYLNIINGEIVTNAVSTNGPYAKTFMLIGSDSTGGVDFKVRYENITFTVPDENTNTYAVMEQTTASTSFNVTVTFTDCTFDFEGTTNKVRPFYLTKDGNAVVDVYVNGGQFILSTQDKMDIVYRPSGQTAGSVTFGKNANGEYPVILVNQGTTAPTQTVELDNGKNGGFGISETKNGKDVYTVGYAIETPYGTIPAAYSNVEKYPFVVFKKDGTFFGAYSCLFGNTDTNNGGNLSIIAMHGARSAGDGAIILMRRDWTYTDNVSYPNIGNNSGTVTLDLGGFTIYDKHTYIGGLFVLRSKANPKTNTLVVKNGGIMIGHQSSLVSCLEHSNSITDTVLNLVLRDLTIGYMAEGTTNVVIVRDYMPTNNLGYNITVKDCTIDMTGAPKGAKLVDLGTGVVNVELDGIKVIGGEKATVKHSVSLYTDFLYTVYVPADGVSYIELAGVRYGNLAELETETLDGVKYYKLSLRINPFGAYDTVILTVGGEEAETHEIGIISYIETVIQDTNPVNSALAKDMLSYVAAAYSFFAPASEEAKAVMALALEILGEGYDAANMPTPAEKKQSIAGLDAAALLIDGAPAFVFYPETDADGNLVYSVDKYSFTVGGEAVTPETVTKNGVSYLVVRLAAYRMLDTVAYTVADTDISGEYNLSAYLDFAASDPALESLVLRLMKYAESAEVYRVANSD
ncbi:MAG: Ig-like domain-containing protein [Clostridia bacterium]|nr:Ig-like domain-containing protein [Clostridia bacterium]